MLQQVTIRLTDTLEIILPEHSKVPVLKQCVTMDFWKKISSNITTDRKTPFGDADFMITAHIAFRNKNYE